MSFARRTPVATVTKIYTHAQILTSPTVNLALVPAPAAGHVLWPIGGFITSHLAVDYTNAASGDLVIPQVGWFDGVSFISWMRMLKSGDKLVAGGGSTYLGRLPDVAWADNNIDVVTFGRMYNASTLMIGFPLMFSFDNGAHGNFTGGDAANTITIVLDYATVAVG